MEPFLPGLFLRDFDNSDDTAVVRYVVALACNRSSPLRCPENMVRDPALLILVGQRHLLPLCVPTIDLSTTSRVGFALDELNFSHDNHRSGASGATLAGVSVPWPPKQDP